MTTSADRVAGWIVAHRRRILVAWFLVVAGLWMQGRRVDRLIDSTQLPADNSEAAWVEAALAQHFANPYVVAAILVAKPVPDSGPQRDALEQVVNDSLEAIPFVTGVTALEPNDGSLSERGTRLWLVGLHPDSARSDASVLRLRAVSAALATDPRVPDDIELGWTGAPALNHDVRRLSADDVARSERRVLPVTAVLLVVVFGSLASALLPIVVGVLAVMTSLGAAAILSPFFPLTVLLNSIVTMLGLGLGIDYTLLIVTRFREAMRGGIDPMAAATTALRQAGATIATSAVTVMVGFAALLVVPALELRSIATGGLLVAGASMLLATTLVPALLVWSGSGMEWGGLRWTRAHRLRSPWPRFGRVVVTHPVLVLLLGLVPLVALGWQARRARTDLPSGNWLPRALESSRATDEVLNAGLGGEVQALQVLVSFPAGVAATSDAGWTAVDRLGAHFMTDPRVDTIRSMPALTGATSPSVTLLSMMPRLRGRYVSRDEQHALIEVLPHSDATPAVLVQLVHDARRLDAAAIGGVSGLTIRVGGIPAANADYATAVGGSVRTVVLLVLGGTLVALLVAFKSVLVPIKAMLLNLLSVAAAFGAAVLVFQDGHGARLIGLSSPIDGLFPAVPILVFCLVYGLSMDYEVFLIARVAEAVREGKSNDDAIVHGVSHTARVISSAAAVMVTVFTGFALGEFLLVKLLGFTLAVAVLLDATLVRLVIGPALLRLAGHWNWWPGQSRGGEPD